MRDREPECTRVGHLRHSIISFHSVTWSLPHHEQTYCIQNGSWSSITHERIARRVDYASLCLDRFLSYHSASPEKRFPVSPCLPVRLFVIPQGFVHHHFVVQENAHVTGTDNYTVDGIDISTVRGMGWWFSLWIRKTLKGLASFCTTDCLLMHRLC